MNLDHRPLLDPSPLPLETGYERLPDGTLHVACRTDLHGCTGEMFQWWFSTCRPDDRQYRWWHPVDHVSSRWIDTTDGTEVGSTHVVEEAVTTFPVTPVVVQFRDPLEVFDADDLDAARTRGAVSCVVAGRVAPSHTPDRGPDGAVLGGRLVHLGRDTDWGLVLRSHFHFSPDLAELGFPPDDIASLFPDELGRAILQHCYNEMTFLSRFLPSMFLGDNHATHPVALPW